MDIENTVQMKDELYLLMSEMLELEHRLFNAKQEYLSHDYYLEKRKIPETPSHCRRWDRMYEDSVIDGLECMLMCGDIPEDLDPGYAEYADPISGRMPILSMKKEEAYYDRILDALSQMESKESEIENIHKQINRLHMPDTQTEKHFFDESLEKDILRERRLAWDDILNSLADKSINRYLSQLVCDGWL